MSTVAQIPRPGDIQAYLIGEVRAWMGRRGVNQTELADALGISQSQLSKRLRGMIAIDINEIGRIAAYLEVSPATLIGGYEPPPRPGGGVSMGTARYPMSFAA